MSINEQKKFLDDNLLVESLRTHDNNKEDIKNFEQAEYGERLSNYLIDNAWDEDSCGNTKVFLVRDKNTREIAFYYALNCGIVYSELIQYNLSEIEEVLVKKYINAIRMGCKKNLTLEERDEANHAYEKALGEFDKKINDANRVTMLINLAEEKAMLKEETEEALQETKEGKYIKQVKETFPAIDVKLFCRNKKYKPGVKLDFKLGVYVFWEIIVPHILKIADMVGCKYVYLFAADNTKLYEQNQTMAPMWTPDYDPYDEEESSTSKEKRKLLDYYTAELKFHQVSEYTILKPHFECDCYTLMQDVEGLQKKREAVWASHDENN